MPGRAEPAWNPAGRFAGIIDGAPVRLALLIYLTQHPDGAKVAELSTAIGVAEPTIRNQLKGLMKTGVITNDVDPYFSTQGQRSRYFVDRNKLVNELIDFLDQLGLVLIDPHGPPRAIPRTTATTVTLDVLIQLIEHSKSDPPGIAFSEP